MTPFAFDTLSASKRLREAGMSEGVAEAVVAVFQHATASVDFGQLATKTDIAHMATKTDIADMATKADIADMATKADIAEMATKADIAEMATKADIADMATKADIARLATKADIADMATKADIADMATKSDLEVLHQAVKRDFAVLTAETGLKLSQLELHIQRRSDQQMWGVIGLLSGVIAVATTVIKFFP